MPQAGNVRIKPEEVDAIRRILVFVESEEVTQKDIDIVEGFLERAQDVVDEEEPPF